MRDYNEGLLNETMELADKITNLSAFMSSDEFKSIPIIQRNLLRSQKIHMLEYLKVLNQRIASSPKADE